MKLNPMKSLSLFLIFLTVSACSTQTINTSGRLTEKMKEAKICLIPSLPTQKIEYKVIRKIKFGKGSFGKVNDSLYQLIDQAKVLKADAIINYMGSQRFGFWPWRITRPVLRGEAIIWKSKQKVKCEDVGGKLY